MYGDYSKIFVYSLRWNVYVTNQNRDLGNVM